MSSKHGSRTSARVLPEDKDAGDLLRRLQTVATQSNLQIKSFKPSATVTKQLHAEWPISLELEGTYHNLAIFFDRVGKFTRIVNITDVDIRGQDAAGTERQHHRQVRGHDLRAARQAVSAQTRRGQAGREEGLSMHRRLIIAALGPLFTLPQMARAQAEAPQALPSCAATRRQRRRRPRHHHHSRRRRTTSTTRRAAAIPSRIRSDKGSGPRLTIQRGEGKAGLSVAELSVRGVMQSRGGFIATVQGPDGKTYIIHAGDKLADGVVRAVNAEGIIVVQEVSDPLSLVRQREVSRKLRSLEAKP